MSTRREFVRRSAVALAVAPFVSVAKWVPASRTPSMLDLLREVAYPTLGYEVPYARVVELPRTGDARKYQVAMVGRSGRWARQAVMISSLVQTLTRSRADERAELAYQIRKRARECARDIAHMEGIDWRRNEREWQA